MGTWYTIDVQTRIIYSFNDCVPIWMTHVQQFPVSTYNKCWLWVKSNRKFSLVSKTTIMFGLLKKLSYFISDDSI